MRHRKDNLLDDLFEVTSYFPWWVGVSLAAISFAVLHYLAGRELAAATTPGAFGANLTSVVIRAFATVGQYLLPLVFIGGAVASAIQRHRKKALVTQVTNGERVSVLNEMTWREFEALVSEAFRFDGYVVSETGKAGPDGGVDLVLTKENEKSLVQCKQWRAMKVSVTVVRELYGLMAAQGAANGYVVTSGEFTSDAIDFAQGRNIHLINGPVLFQMFDKVREAVGRAPHASAPQCPNCAKPMVKRVAKKGSYSGQLFWGCSAYPACKGTRSIS